MKRIKLFEEFNMDEIIQDEEELEWEQDCRKPTEEEQDLMRKKLKNYAYNYSEVCDNHVLLAYPMQHDGEDNIWGRVPLSTLKDPSVDTINTKHVEDLR